jgi:hypothetical protein
MASLTRETMNKRSSKLYRQGRKRKNKLAKKSTLSYQELFAKMGEPEKA